MRNRMNWMMAALIWCVLFLVSCTLQPDHLEPISMEEAKERALRDAGITDERIVFTTSQLKTKNEKEYYELVFFADGSRYEYDIDAFTGILIEADRPEIKVEEESTYTQENLEELQKHVWEEYDKQQKLIEEMNVNLQKMEEEREKMETESNQHAKEIALAQVPGATIEDIYDFEVDYEDGRITYEGTILYGEMEYDFEIDGYSGAIRDWDVESIYD